MMHATTPPLTLTRNQRRALTLLLLVLVAVARSVVTAFAVRSHPAHAPAVRPPALRTPAGGSNHGYYQFV